MVAHKNDVRRTSHTCPDFWATWIYKIYNHIIIYVFVYSPHLCVGFLILILYPAPASSSATPRFHSHTTLSHTIFHTQLCHYTIFHHTIFHTQLCHKPSFTHMSHLCHTPFFARTPSLTHTAWSHTIFHHTILHTHLCHTPSFTHSFVTHHLSHTIFHTPLRHTPSFTTPSFTHIFVTYYLSPPPSFTHVFVTHNLSTPSLRGRRSTWRQRFFAWQAWDLVTSTFTSRGRRGTW